MIYNVCNIEGQTKKNVIRPLSKTVGKFLTNVDMYLPLD